MVGQQSVELRGCLELRKVAGIVEPLEPHVRRQSGTLRRLDDRVGVAPNHQHRAHERCQIPIEAHRYAAAWKRGVRDRGQRGRDAIDALVLLKILDKLAAITGLPSPSVKLPYAVAYAAGMVDTLVTGTILKREPRVTLDSVRMGRKKMFVTSAKAERELGWNPGPVDGALQRAVEWFRAHGYAP